MSSLKKVDDELHVQISGENFTRDKDLVGTIPGRRFDWDTKLWVCPATPDNAEKLMLGMRPSADPKILAWIKEHKQEKAAELVTPIPDDAEVNVPWGDKLYAYQRAFVAWAADHPQLILADDMGLGKTFQAISAVEEHHIRTAADLGPKLVICPASVKGVWPREIKKLLGDDEPYVVIQGSYSPRKAKPGEAERLGLKVDDPKKLPRLTAAQVRKLVLMDAIQDNAWVIVNWEQIRVTKEERSRKVKVRLPNGVERMETRKETVEVLREPLFGETKWEAVIADESHRAKSRKALQTKGLWKIGGTMKLALTGTPIMNSPDELWPILRWLYPDEFGKSIPARWKDGVQVQAPVPKQAFWAFFDMYVDSYDSDYGKVITGARNPDALRFLLAKKLVRRTKGDKLDLPPKVREVIPVVLGKKQRDLYDRTEKEMWLEVKQAITDGDKALAKAAGLVAEGKLSIYDMPNGAVRTSRLRQVASTPALLGADDDSAKLDTAVEIIMDAQPKQFAVFAEYVETCEILVERLTKKGIRAKAWTGKVSASDRTQMEDDFQAGEIDVLVGTIKAMGVGVTLTAADTAIFIERDWTPANNEQAEDRLWRNGQDNHVTILILEGVDTVDSSKVKPTNDVKSLIVKAVIQQDDVETRTKEAA